MSSTQISTTSSEGEGGGVPLYSPVQARPQARNSKVADQDSHAVATSDDSDAAPVGALVPTGTLADVSAMCQEAQTRIMTLLQAVGRQPGVTGQINALINNDLRVVCQLFISVQHICTTADNRQAHELAKSKDELLEPLQQLQAANRRLAEAESMVIELERAQQENEAGFTSYVKNLKKELADKEKTIEDLRKELKGRELNTRRASLSSATTAAGLSSAVTSDEETKYVSKLHPPSRYSAQNADEFWRKNKGVREELYARLSKIEEPEVKEPLDLEAMRRFRIKPEKPEVKPQVMHAMEDTMRPMKPEILRSRRTAVTDENTPPTREFYQSKPKPLMPTAREFRPTFSSPESHSGFSPDPSAAHSQRSNALIRRVEDADADPETKLWKDHFYQQFTMALVWLQRYCGEVYPDATARISRYRNSLWPYLCGLTYPTNPVAGHSHATHMLNDPVQRPYFLLRAILQYLEQNIWGVKMWLGIDRNQDRNLLEADSRASGNGYPYNDRQWGVDTRRAIIQQLMKSEGYLRFQSYKGHEIVDRLKELTGPFLNPLASKQEASLDLHVIATLAMDLSTKMVASRLAFNISWLECGVKFGDDTHTALNNDAPGTALQFKHYRVMLVVTPSISYRDDSRRHPTTRGVTKAQVLVMQ